MRAFSKTTCRSYRGDTLSLFQKLGGRNANTLLFESMDGSGRNNVKSLLFIENALRIESRGNEVHIFSLNDNGDSALLEAETPLRNMGEVTLSPKLVTVRFPSRVQAGTDEERISAPSPADVLRLFCNSWKRLGDEEGPLFLPGVFSYDFIDILECIGEPKQDLLSFPDFVFWLPGKTVIVDHIEKTISATACLFGNEDSIALDNGLCQILGAIDAAGEQTEDHITPVNKETMEPPSSVDLDDGGFEKLVDRLKSHIKAGDVFQIVPSRTFSAVCKDPLRAYGELRKLNPSPYMFVVNGKDFCLFGASPESCVSVSKKPHRLTLRPIAGTRPRGFDRDGKIDRDLDNRLEAELKLNEKELAEHMMLVDLARNDVARISIPGSRHVLRLLEVERYSHVMHLVSEVEGSLREGLDAMHAYMASMNMGTLVGAPKIEAARLLRKYEGSKRGTYGGAVGYLSSDGDLDTAIIIRSAIVKDDVAYVRAGAGVVFDSDPEAEARETQNKAKAVLLAIERAKE